MSTAILEKETRVHLIGWLYFAVLLALFLLILIRQSKDVNDDIEMEMMHMVDYMSVPEYTELQSRIVNRYNYIMVEKKVYETVYDLLAPTGQKTYAEQWQENASAGLISNATMFRIIENFRLYSYQIIHRVTLMQYWTTLMLPLMVAILFTGYYRWRIKLYQLVGQSTSLVRIWMKVMWLMLSLFLIFLITPNLFGPYSIFAPPVLLIVIALSISFVISSFTKSP